MKKFIIGFILGMMVAVIPGAVATMLAPVEYNDVTEDDWFYEEVISLAEEGYAYGYPDGSFRPNNNITRAETAKLITKADSFIDRNTQGRLTLEEKVEILEAKIGTLEFPGDCYYDDSWFSDGDMIDSAGCECQADGTLRLCEVDL
jgi:hypothetical protein